MYIYKYLLKWKFVTLDRIVTFRFRNVSAVRYTFPVVCTVPHGVRINHYFIRTFPLILFRKSCNTLFVIILLDNSNYLVIRNVKTIIFIIIIINTSFIALYFIMVKRNCTLQRITSQYRNNRGIFKGNSSN